MPRVTLRDVAHAAALVEWVRARRPDVIAAFHVGAWWRLREAFAQAYAAVVVPIDYRRSAERPFAGLADSAPNCSLAAADLLDGAVRLRNRGVSQSTRQELLRPEWLESASPSPPPPAVPTRRGGRSGARTAP